MSINFEAQNICLLAAKIGQRCPDHDPHEIAKVASKLYRLAVSIRNRGDIAACMPQAAKLADSVGGVFEVLPDCEDIQCFLLLAGKRERVV